MAGVGQYSTPKITIPLVSQSHGTKGRERVYCKKSEVIFKTVSITTKLSHAQISSFTLRRLIWRARKSFDVVVDLPLTPSSSDSPPDDASLSPPPGPQSRSWRWRAQLLGEEGEARAQTVWTGHFYLPVGSAAASCFQRADWDRVR